MDPVLLDIFKLNTPTFWSDLDWSTQNRQKILKDAERFGVGPYGYTIPIFGPSGQLAIFSLSDDRKDECIRNFIRDHGAQIIRYADIFNEQVIRLNTDRILRGNIRLSRREREVATMIAMGHSRPKIARILGISEHTVREYADGFRSKMGTENIVHAVARAASARLIFA